MAYTILASRSEFPGCFFAGNTMQRELIPFLDIPRDHQIPCHGTSVAEKQIMDSNLAEEDEDEEGVKDFETGEQESEDGNVHVDIQDHSMSLLEEGRKLPTKPPTRAWSLHHEERLYTSSSNQKPRGIPSRTPSLPFDYCHDLVEMSSTLPLANMALGRWFSTYMLVSHRESPFRPKTH